MEKLGERNWTLIEQAAGMVGLKDTFDYIYESLQIDEVEEMEQFLIWLYTNKLPIGESNYEQVFKFFKEDTPREEIVEWFKKEFDYDINEMNELMEV